MGKRWLAICLLLITLLGCSKKITTNEAINHLRWDRNAEVITIHDTLITKEICIDTIIKMDTLNKIYTIENNKMTIKVIKQNDTLFAIKTVVKPDTFYTVKEVIKVVRQKEPSYIETLLTPTMLYVVIFSVLILGGLWGVVRLIK